MVLSFCLFLSKLCSIRAIFRSIELLLNFTYELLYQQSFCYITIKSESFSIDKMLLISWTILTRVKFPSRIALKVDIKFALSIYMYPVFKFRADFLQKVFNCPGIGQKALHPLPCKNRPSIVSHVNWYFLVYKRKSFHLM